MIYRRPGFIAAFQFGSYTTPSPLFRQQVFYLSQSSFFMCVVGPAYRREMGDGVWGGAKSHEGEKGVGSL